MRAKYPDDWQQRPFDGKVMHNSSGGMPHGRLAIGDVAIKKSDIVAVAKASNIRPSNSMAYQNLRRRFEEAIDSNQNLVNDNEALRERLDRADRLIEMLYGKLDMEIPDEIPDQQTDEEVATVDGSSHASAHSSSSEDVA